LAAALDSYKEYVQYHRSLRTFRTYRPILEGFKKFCTKAYVDEVERQDFIDFATHCMKKGQKGKSIYNKLVVLSQVMKQHGRAKLLNTSDWPKFVETVRPIYEDAELTKLFQACTPAEEARFKFYLMTGFRGCRRTLRHLARCRFQTHGGPCDGKTAFGISSKELGGNDGSSPREVDPTASEVSARLQRTLTILCFRAPQAGQMERCWKS
jgi:Phage integrase SAM-like domain